jgi:octaprenyl-diphosphate synthase
MITLDQIKAPVAKELDNYEAYLRETLHSDNRLTGEMLDYIMNTRGKAVRPLLVLLCAAMCGGAGREESYMAAMLVEMIHTATLVHDDVIDGAAIRRGRPSVNAIWQPQRAVLIGDFILARCFSVGMESGRYKILDYITRSMTALCEGELLQSEMSDSLAMTRPVYEEIIYNKTATLIGTSCGVGAMSADAPDRVVALMKKIGDAAGMAFQIKDDMLDYRPSSDTGKPLCGDLRERKITLPLLTVLERSDEARRREIIHLLSQVSTHPENIETLYGIVVDGGGLEMAATVMAGYVESAVSSLIADNFPPSPYRDSLENLFHYIAERGR